MTRLSKISVTAAFLLLFSISTPGASAQDIGAILDWINKTSGPRFGGVGASLTVPLSVLEDREADLPGADLRYRLDTILQYGYDREGVVNPDDASVRMLTFRNTVVARLKELPVDVAAGLSVHRFYGDFDGFWHLSIPLQALLRWSLSESATLRVGPGVHILPAFDTDDFAPLTVDVSRDDSEAVLGFVLGVDFDVF